VITDITLQKQAAEAMRIAKQHAEAAAAAKAQFLANMSHELRTPLNGVVGMASMLGTTTLDARQRRFVDTMKASAEALIAIVNDVLDFSKADAGKLQMARDEVPLRAQIDDVVGLFAARAFDNGLDLAGVVMDDCPATIIGDAVRLRQVLANLVSNAIKFTERGQVLVSAEVVPVADGRAETVRIVIADTGIGIAAEQKERVFDAFAQADASITRRFGGTGLGLAICRQLVEGMGGSIGFDSEPGVGSRFWLSLPAATGAGHGATTERTSARAVLIAPAGPIRSGLECVAISRFEQVVVASDIAETIESLARWPAHALSLVVVLDDDFIHGESTAIADWIALERPRWRVTWRGLRRPTDARAPLPGLDCLTKPVPLSEVFDVVATGDREEAPTVAAPTQPLAGARVLVVEDNPVNHEIVGAMLEHLGVRVLTAMNGAEGVQMVRSDPSLDLVLMDCQMPVMDGFTAAATIRRDLPERAALPIIALTGNAMPGDREACHAAGMNDYLTKPLVLPALEAALQRWLPSRSGGASAPGARREHAVA
jgi:CheY-like chemotaxis protein